MDALKLAAEVACVFSLTILATPVCANDWKLFADNSDGVAFNYPSIWVVQTQRTNAFRVMVGAVDGAANCTLGTKVEPRLKHMSAEELLRSTSKQDLINGARQNGIDITILDFKATKVGNRHALYYETEQIYRSLNKAAPIRSMNVMTKVDDRVYVFTCSSSPAEVTKDKHIYYSIISSLAIRY